MISIPAELLPGDGRFGAGPSKVRPEQVARLAELGTSLLGTSHRQAPVRALVGEIREGIADLLGAPAGYEVVLGNGGSSIFWDVAVSSLVRERAQLCVFGEFGSKFADAVTAAPFAEAVVRRAEPGALVRPEAAAGIDVYAWPHNETSTGVMAPVARPEGGDDDALVVVDATSGAGALPVDLAETDVYYFAPQKVFASDGGLWLAVLSPRAIARVEQVAASGRWIPGSLDLGAALTQSRLDQTVNTPALATLILLHEQLDWLRAKGGLAWAAARSRESSDLVYRWAEEHAQATPFVTDPAARSTVVATVDLDDAISAPQVAATLRAHGVVDVEPYRKLGRNQLRIAAFPAIEPEDVAALLRCIDHVLTQL